MTKTASPARFDPARPPFPNRSAPGRGSSPLLSLCASAAEKIDRTRLADNQPAHWRLPDDWWLRRSRHGRKITLVAMTEMISRRMPPTHDQLAGTQAAPVQTVLDHRRMRIGRSGFAPA